MIIQATESDLPAIKELMQSESGFWQDCWRDDVLERGLATSDGLAFVWEEDVRIVGFVCAHDLGFRAYLSALVVARSARGRGVGTQLVERVQLELAAQGCAVLVADVRRDAEGFYKSLGWSEPHATLLRKKLGEELNQQGDAD